MRTKTLIYKTLKYSNDVNAVRKRRVGRRIGRRVAGKIMGRLFAKIFC